MISRRDVLSIGIVLAAPLITEAQQAGKVYRIGILAPIPRTPGLSEFLQALRDLDYVDGRNVVIEYRSAEGQLDRLPGLAEELVNTRIDVIFALATSAAQAAKNATKTIPIVFAGANDPIKTGLVVSLARPGGNVTGPTNIGPDLSGKRLALLKESSRRSHASPSSGTRPIRALRGRCTRVRPQLVRWEYRFTWWRSGAPTISMARSGPSRRDGTAGSS